MTLRLWSLTEIDVAQYHPEDVPKHHEDNWSNDKGDAPATEKLEAAQVPKDHQQHTAE